MKELETKLKTATKELNVARKKYLKLKRLQENSIEIPKKRLLIGKCFKYKNNYSCPEKPSDYWFLYVRIDSLSKDGDLFSTQFQTDMYGKFLFEKREYFQFSDSYIEISGSLFIQELSKARNKIK